MSGYAKKDRDRKKKPCDCGKEIDCAKCEPLSPCPKKILLECGTPGSSMTFTAATQTLDVAHVTVDTSWFCKPVTELQFSSQVSAVLEPLQAVLAADVVDAEVVLQYDLICRRNGGCDIVIGSYTFRRFLSATAADNAPNQTLETSDTFSFNKCICASSCPGCIDYFVRVTANTVSASNTASTTVSMGQLVAKIQDF